MTIQAIPVRWNNTDFDSQTEARFAIFFHSLGIEWRREPQAYAFGNQPGDGYLCDYWLPQFEVWAEIKGPGFTDRQRWKCAELAVGTGYPVLMLFDQPAFKAWEVFVPEDGEAVLYECFLTTEQIAEGRLPMWTAPARSIYQEKRIIAEWSRRLRADHQYVAAVEAALNERFEGRKNR